MTFLPDSRLLFIDADGAMLAWPVGWGNQRLGGGKAQVVGHVSGVVKALVRSGSRLVVVTDDRVVVHDIRSLQPLASAQLVAGAQLVDGWVANAAISANGRWLATITNTGLLHVSDLNDLPTGTMTCHAAMRVDGALFECIWNGSTDIFAVGRRGVYAFTFRPPAY